MYILKKSNQTDEDSFKKETKFCDSVKGRGELQIPLSGQARLQFPKYT